MSRLFKGRWFMALYDDEGLIVLEADNAREFGRLIGIPTREAKRMMRDLFPGGSARHASHCFVWGRRCTAYFYDPEGTGARCSDAPGKEGI